jgi:membrane fusion protein (multidrug efflux system)
MSRRDERRAFVIVVLATTLLAPLGGCAGDQGGGPRGPRAVRVALASVEERTLEDAVEGIGTLRAKLRVQLRPEASGRVIEIPFEEGGRVARGTLLYRLDDSETRADVAARKAALAAARTERDNAGRRFARYASVDDPDAITGDALDEARTAFEAARAEVERLEAEVERAQERLADTRLEAPLEGVIGESLVDVGDYVEEGDLLATMHSPDVLEIAFTLPERHRARVERGLSVRLSVATQPDQPIPGTVTYVDPEIDAATRDFLVKADIPNSEGLLTPGSFGSVELTLERLPDRLVIPEAALVATREGYIVFVVEDGKAQRRDVRVGLRTPGLVEIREGLARGERVVETGHMNLADGTPVEPLEAEAEQPQSGSGGGPDGKPA